MIAWEEPEWLAEAVSWQGQLKTQIHDCSDKDLANFVSRVNRREEPWAYAYMESNIEECLRICEWEHDRRTLLRSAAHDSHLLVAAKATNTSKCQLLIAAEKD